MINYLFTFTFFALPLIFFPKTSEVFEFNKMIFVYILTVLVLCAWIIKMLTIKKLIFRRTLLDIPLLLFLATQIVSTIFSIDPRTSLFGYYSRLNGGLLSLFSYSILYWAYVSNSDKNSNNRNLIALIASGVLVSIWGVMEHMGRSPSCLFIYGQLNNACWVQDVKERVFATLGQPNWLAAFLVILLPFSSFKLINSQKNSNKLIWLIISILFFTTLLFTKSRSGLLAFGVSSIIFWGFYLIQNFKKNISVFIILNLIFAGAFLTFNPFGVAPKDAPALENQGTESGEIRKIVWRGALDVWRAYPIVGSGVETFAYSYAQFKPLEQNQTSEWDFVYNKAHNEFLNYLATTGVLGFSAYLIFVTFSILQIFKSKSKLKIALIAAYFSIFITNFFGFSVVLTNLLFFLIPAMAVADKEKLKAKNSNKIFAAGALAVGAVLLYLIAQYWRADFLYAEAKRNYDAGKIKASVEKLNTAIEIAPTEPLYSNELANIYADLAVALAREGKPEDAEIFMAEAINVSKNTLALSPNNFVLRRSVIALYYRLSDVNPQNLEEAEALSLTTIKLIPNDPRLYLMLAKIARRLGKMDNASAAVKEALRLKPDYADAQEFFGIIEE